MAKQRVLIFGAGGMLGQELVQEFNTDARFFIIPSNHNRTDITDSAAVRNVLKAAKPNIVINCAANIQVDECEAHPSDAWRVNALGPGIIVNAIGKMKAKPMFIQCSTSDVFSARPGKQFRTDSTPQPVNMYGWSKRGGEIITAAEAKAGKVRYAIVRMPWIYSERRMTFVDVVADSLNQRKPIAIAGDQYNVPVWTRDIARKLKDLLTEHRKLKSGVYHFSSREQKTFSRYDVACVIANILHADPKLLKKVSQRSIFKAPRPISSMLVPSPGTKLPPWKTSLRTYLLAHYSPSPKRAHLL